MSPDRNGPDRNGQSEKSRTHLYNVLRQVFSNLLVLISWLELPLKGFFLSDSLYYFLEQILHVDFCLLAELVKQITSQTMHRALNKYLVGVWSDNVTATFFISFILTVFVPDIEGTQNKVLCL